MLSLRLALSEYMLLYLEHDLKWSTDFFLVRDKNYVLKSKWGWIVQLSLSWAPFHPELSPAFSPLQEVLYVRRKK